VLFGFTGAESLFRKENNTASSPETRAGKGGFAMFNEAVKKFKAWITREDVDSLTRLLSKYSLEIDDFARSLESRVKLLEESEASRGEAIEGMLSCVAEPIKPVCDDCISMRLELDAMRSRLDALEAAGKGGVDSKPKRRRGKSDAKELVA
jgi:hypothetical protein